MVPIARAFDSVRALCLALLPTIVLTFAFNALTVHGAMFAAANEVAPVDDGMISASASVDEMSGDHEVAQLDAAVTAINTTITLSTAAIVFDNDDVDEVEVFDRAKQCCMGQARRLYYGPRWHWMIP